MEEDIQEFCSIYIRRLAEISELTKKGKMDEVKVKIAELKRDMNSDTSSLLQII